MSGPRWASIRKWHESREDKGESMVRLVGLILQDYESCTGRKYKRWLRQHAIGCIELMHRHDRTRAMRRELDGEGTENGNV